MYEINRTEGSQSSTPLKKDKLPRWHLIANLLAVLLPFVGLVAACILLWGYGITWVELGLLIGMYVITTIGITVGFHRLFTHRSFETSRVMQSIMAVLGSMAVQGSLLKWVALHRRHHQHSDDVNDPHSPHHSGRGFLGIIKGFWHAHIGWIFAPDPGNLYNYVKDLDKSKLIRVMSGLFPLWVVIGLLLPAILGGIISGSWMGVLLGFLWGGLIRVMLVHHVTWSINSICHLWGGKPYKSHDESRNNPIMGILALGEGWHNNHHAFPTSAKHGLRWWQIDFSYWVIRVMSWFRLVWKVRVPDKKDLNPQPEPEATPSQVAVMN